ncbi:tetratricopeptide repeat protein [Massilia antarctica]|uniref:Tetratricopeptide repeat protein n=1 Tax=Massilia antarctica TaxID=2765360 RepID=A0AA49A6B6_9BURK|nr:tetratricopeptide repeat protein [Massilia antarctica]QPI48228.1 tetratricopeptide repeat protein [Massilia antarctica]
MSLINKMLQDLDKRGAPGADGAPADIRPVGRSERAVPLPVVMGALAGVLILGAGAAIGWRFLHQQPVAPGPQLVIKPPEQLPLPQAVQPPQIARVATTPPPPQPAASPATESSTLRRIPELEKMQKTLLQSTRDASLAAPAVTDKGLPAGQSAQKELPALARTERERIRRSREPEVAAAEAGKNRPAAPLRTKTLETDVEVAPQSGRQAPAGLGAEGAYRRALASLQEGRIAEAVAQLEQALGIDARHEAARQTLVGILIEQRRTDEAMRLLQAGLALDTRQPAMAMLLARLQIDSGGSGVATLMASLPAAVGNGEYHAFLAGALQRERRHQEAVEQYQAALRGTPDNAVWSMGLGISLEAEKRLPEALAAFQRARAAGTLSPELQGFVERKVGALGR